MPYHDVCVATTVDAKALRMILDTPTSGGSFTQPHPWILAREEHMRARSLERDMVVLFATSESPELSHWAPITEIEVREYQGSDAESIVHFGELQEIGEIWRSLDSVFLKPSAEQLRREELEAVRPTRTSLNAHHIHPYALCEAPPFLAVLDRERGATQRPADSGETG